MNLGLVGWPSETGLGMEIRDAVRYLPVSGIFYMNHPGKPMTEEFKEKTVGDRNLVSKMEAFVDENKIDTILTWETPGNWEFPKLWKRKDIRWYCVIHWDWFAPKKIEAWKTAKLLVPFDAASFGLQLIYGLESKVIPVPVDLGRLEYRNRKRAEKFVTVYAMGGPKDRRSIKEIVQAWDLMGDKAPPLTIHAQKEPKELEGIPLSPAISLKMGGAKSPSDLYRDSDVALMPSKYEGVGLSLIEAQASGLPVITTDMEPMRSIAPKHLVTGPHGDVEIMEDHKVAVRFPTAQSIAERVLGMAHEDISEASEEARRHIQEKYSWAALKDRWIRTLEES